MIDIISTELSSHAIVVVVIILGLSPEKNPRIYRRDCGVWLWGKNKRTNTLFTAQHPEPVLSAVDHVFKSLFLFLTGLIQRKKKKALRIPYVGGTEPHCMIKKGLI